MTCTADLARVLTASWLLPSPGQVAEGHAWLCW